MYSGYPGMEPRTEVRGILLARGTQKAYTADVLAGWLEMKQV